MHKILPNINTSDYDKKFRLLQAECCKGCDAQLQEAKQVKEKSELTDTKLLAPSLT